MLALIPLAAFFFAQHGDPVPPTPHDRVVALEITADDPPLIEGRGPSVVYEYEVEFSGTLHVWTRSELDLFLRVEDTSTRQVLAEDDDSGGGTTPYLELTIEPGAKLTVSIASTRPEELGALELHVVAAPESEATLEAAKTGQTGIDEARRLRLKGDLDAERALVEGSVSELLAVAGAQHSESISEVLGGLGSLADELGHLKSSLSSWTAAGLHCERTLPRDHPDKLRAWTHLGTTQGLMGDLSGARELHETVVAGYERTLPEDHPDLLRVRTKLATTVADMGDLPGARMLQIEVLAGYERTLPEDNLDRLRARMGLAATLWQMGDPRSARVLLDSVIAGFERQLPEDHPDLLFARMNLGATMFPVRDHLGARTLFESVLAGYERTYPEDHTHLLWARGNLAATMYAMGDLLDARALLESAVTGLERTHPEDNPHLLATRMNLANVIKDMGDLPGARAIYESVLERFEATLPEDHPYLTAARKNLAIAVRRMGDFPRALALYQTVLAGYERTLPEDHPYLLTARMNLANTMVKVGDLLDARALLESVLATRERTLPEDHLEILRARGSLAGTMLEMGELPGARVLLESALAGFERTLPEDHADILITRVNLSRAVWEMGDRLAARLLLESALAGMERTLPEDDPNLLRARANMALTMEQMDDLPGAHALYLSVLASYERSLPDHHPDLLGIRLNLVRTVRGMGDLPGSRALEESVLAGIERTLPEDHPMLLKARMNLAGTMLAMEDLSGALALLEAVLAASQRTLPEDHPMLLKARMNLAVTMDQMGDLAGARELVPAQIAGLRAQALGSLILAPREARAAVGAQADLLNGVFALTEPADSELRGSIFELQETMRMVVGEAARAVRRSKAPEIETAMREARSVRAALNDLVSSPSASDSNELSSELTRLLRKRDRLEGKASRLLAERGVMTRPIEVGVLADALRADAAAIGFRRVASWYRDEETGRMSSGRMLAHVLLPEGSLTLIDLGKASELEALAARWRADLNAPLSRAVDAQSDPLRGETVEDGEGESDREKATGEALRAQLLDPILSVLGEETRRLHVCADDVVFVVPLDALPLEDGRVGDRWSVMNEVSFARLLAPGAPAAVEPGLLALGGVDYDAGGASSEGSEARLGSSRSRLPDRFSSLSQTRLEVETAGALFEELLDAEPVIVTRTKATKAALFESAPGKCYLHLATHGWFAPETIPSTLDEEGGERAGRGWARMGLEERLGMGPMLLCGLALAGANRGRDSLGRMNGILTAEELCSLDLAACELAVLSACETNVGLRRAGQGIQSLQAALYAAGARSSITSLWKVDDEATRRLMEHFYTKLWEEKKPKAEALWEAKCALREEGASVRDWAGWVLTGAPD